MLRAIAAILIVIGLAAPALAQSQADFVSAFSGKWQVYEPEMAAGSGMCQLNLAGLATDGVLGVSTTGCAAPLAAVRLWQIQGSQLLLIDAQGKPVARLGGNQKRITGATEASLPLILERVGGDGTAASLEAAYNASGCYYLGYTTTCAPSAELARPAAVKGGKMQIQLQVNLNVRNEPRSDADIIGTAQKSACIVVDSCITASDGPWCRATFGTATGWLRKLGLRQNRWPVVGYTNSCQN